MATIDNSSTPSVFLILANHKNDKGEEPKLTAVKIENGQLSEISSVSFNNNGFKEGYSMTVHQVVKERVDYVICGGVGQIVVCVFKANKITVLRYLEHLHKGPVIDIGIISNKIYTIGVNDNKINQIVVPNDLIQGNIIMNKNAAGGDLGDIDDESKKKKKIKFKKSEVEEIPIPGKSKLNKLESFFLFF